MGNTYLLGEEGVTSNYQLRNEFHFSGVHGAMKRSGSRAK